MKQSKAKTDDLIAYGLFAVGATWFAISGLVDGQIRWRGSYIMTPKDELGQYWFWVALFFTCSAVGWTMFARSHRRLSRNRKRKDGLQQ